MFLTPAFDLFGLSIMGFGILVAAAVNFIF
jgi:hypothetical protein